MKIYLPLYAQIIGVSCLNVALMMLFRLIFFSAQFGLGWQTFLLSPVAEKVHVVAMVVNRQLQVIPQNSWNFVLHEFEDFYGVRFYLLNTAQHVIAGNPITLPTRVSNKLTHASAVWSAEAASSGPAIKKRKRDPYVPDFSEFEDDQGRKFPIMFVHTKIPEMHWMAVYMPAGGAMTQPAILLAVSENLWHTRLNSDFRNSLLIIGGSVFVSLLIWWPFVYGITNTLRQVTGATEKIAEGQFETAVLRTWRQDELSRLCVAINRMATRLHSLVGGQKRFLGDISHELSAPVARLQIGVEILENSATIQQQKTVKDIREEIDEISNLINELLAFSKAAIIGKETKLTPVCVDAILETVVPKMCPEDSVKMNIQQELYCLADDLLLERAFGNVLRNSVRYAAAYGIIEVSATRVGKEIKVVVSDSGPGVPEDAIEMLGEPFYRPEASRSRSNGGIGLGLAIVKTCVETCKGSFIVKNNHPKGLNVEIRLPVLEPKTIEPKTSSVTDIH